MEAEFEGAPDVNVCCGISVLLDWAAWKGAELVWKIHDHTEEMKSRE